MFRSVALTPASSISARLRSAARDRQGYSPQQSDRQGASPQLSDWQAQARSLHVGTARARSIQIGKIKARRFRICRAEARIVQIGVAEVSGFQNCRTGSPKLLDRRCLTIKSRPPSGFCAYIDKSPKVSSRTDCRVLMNICQASSDTAPFTLRSVKCRRALRSPTLTPSAPQP